MIVPDWDLVWELPIVDSRQIDFARPPSVNSFRRRIGPWTSPPVSAAARNRSLRFTAVEEIHSCSPPL